MGNQNIEPSYTFKVETVEKFISTLSNFKNIRDGSSILINSIGLEEMNEIQNQYKRMNGYIIVITRISIRKEFPARSLSSGVPVKST